jgi:hypothetical protein
MMRKFLSARRVQIVIAVAMMICLLLLLGQHGGSHGDVFAYILFFPLFLFGLLDLPGLLRVPVCADSALRPQTPALSALFQRPPPSFD